MDERETLLALADRCERERPGEDLDYAIGQTLPVVVGRPRMRHYTTSLDAAVALVPEGCAWEVARSISYVDRAVVYGHDLHFDTEGSAPALALCAASLRARAAMVKESQHG